MIKNDQQIRTEANAVQIIGNHVKLTRRGTNMVGCCPFHTENTPSFVVSPTQNLYHCFGCGEGGNAINFLMEHLKLTYPEALIQAARDSNIEVEYEAQERKQEQLDEAKKQAAHRKDLQDTLHTVQHWYGTTYPLQAIYCDLITKEEIVNADGRHLRRSTADLFGICQTPNTSAAKDSGFWETEKLLELGITAKFDKGYADYDVFKNRLLFKITNNRGQVVALAGRRTKAEDKLPKDQQRAKYINSKDSALYQKSATVFGLHENRKGIQAAKSAILVEGYFDVVSPHDQGVCNLISTCGTALTEPQAQLIKRYTDEVIIFRDNDEAGTKAAQRDVEILVRAGLKVRICILQAPVALLEKIVQKQKWIGEKEIEIAEMQKRADDKFAAQVEKIKALNDKKEAGITIDPTPPIDPKILRETRLLATMQSELSAYTTDLDKFNTSKDPDDFIRAHGKQGFLDLVEDIAQDAILWRIMSSITNKDDIYEREAATQLAASILNLIESETLREYYIRELTKPNNLGSVKRILNDALEVQRKFKGKKSDLTPKQKDDVYNYGMFERDNRYHICSDISGEGWAVSNFVIKPIIFIEGQKESIRLVEVKNDKGDARILDINAKNFVELGPFKQVVEGRGNFRFEGKPEYFGKVKAKIYDNMKSAYPIYTLGLHREGFFTFANGIASDGKFSPVDEFGLVAHADTRYYLPAFSKIRDHVKSDDVDNDYEDEKYYVYTDGEIGINFTDWTKLMRQVHGDNAIPGILYLCSVFIREKIFERLDNMFPHLNFFGQPGSGKNQLAASMIAWFGKYRQPVHIVNSTDAAFFRRIAQVRNGLAWYDEYSNNVEHKRVEALKQFADGTGRTRAQVDNPNRTNSTQVNAGCIISGQQQPTADVALFTRCISLNFHTTEFTQEQQERHARLKKLEQSGRLTQFALQLHQLRGSMTADFTLEFEAAYNRFKELVAGQGIMDRIVRSYAAMLTTYRLLKEKMPFGFTEAEVEAILVAAILTQKESVFQENEVSIFWRIIEFFVANGEIEHGTDLIAEECSDETFDIDWQGKQKDHRDYRPAKRLLYLSFSRCHPLYLERHDRQRKSKGLDLEALKHYLKSSPAYEGMKRAKKIGGRTQVVFVFDCNKLPFDFEDTIAVLARKKQYNHSKIDDPITEPLTPSQAAAFVSQQPTPPAVKYTDDPVDETLPF